MKAEFEDGARQLVEEVTARNQTLQNRQFGNSYAAVKKEIDDFKAYKGHLRRQWLGKRVELDGAVSNLQIKLNSVNRQPYQRPAELEFDGLFSGLESSEAAYQAALAQHMSALKEKLRRDFADLANSISADIRQASGALTNMDEKRPLEEKLVMVQGLVRDLEALQKPSKLPELKRLEEDIQEALIEDNQYCDNTHDDVEFEWKGVLQTCKDAEATLRNQIDQAGQSRLTPEQLKEFTETFQHFDKDKTNTLDKHEFRAGLAGLGQQFEDDVFDMLFARLSTPIHDADGKYVKNVMSFQQFTDYMISVTEDSPTREQVTESFKTVAKGQPTVSADDLRAANVDEDKIARLVQHMPDGDYVAYLDRNWQPTSKSA
jgi:Ca2+-binding EF-hand superfamily protein